MALSVRGTLTGPTTASPPTDRCSEQVVCPIHILQIFSLAMVSVGKYQLIRLLARGGITELHLARSPVFQRDLAIKLLNDRKGADFQGELVEEFIQAIGIYPAGSLVELSSGEVGVVVAEYRTRRLRPQVMVMLDADKKPLGKTRMIDLREQTRTEDGQPLDIVASLKPEAYGINMAAIRL